MESEGHQPKSIYRATYKGIMINIVLQLGIKGLLDQKQHLLVLLTATTAMGNEFRDEKLHRPGHQIAREAEGT